MTKALVYEGLMKRKDALLFKRYWEAHGWSIVLDSADHKDRYHVYRVSKTQSTRTKGTISK